MTLNFTFYNLHNVVAKWAKKCYKKNFFRIMVPTQALIKARQSLLQVIFCTIPARENAWTRKLWSAVHFPYKT